MVRGFQSFGVLAILTSSVLGSGCATIFTGTTDTIAIRSEEKGTQLLVDGQLIGVDSAVHVLPRAGDHVFEARKDGCQTARYPMPYELNAVTLLGIFIDLGLISILLIDGAGTGAAMKASTNSVVLTPLCGGNGKSPWAG